MQIDAVFSGLLFKRQGEEMSGNIMAALRAGYLYRGYEHWLSGDEESIHGNMALRAMNLSLRHLPSWL